MGFSLFMLIYQSVDERGSNPTSKMDVKNADTPDAAEQHPGPTGQSLRAIEMTDSQCDSASTITRSKHILKLLTRLLEYG
jgi:hypothetical protein